MAIQLPFGLPCAFCQLPHLVLAACALLSAVRAFKYQAHAQVAFHALAGAALMFMPQLLHGPTIAGGALDDLHIILQRYTAPFHIGFSLFHYCNSFMARAAGVNPVILFSKAMVAGFLLLNKILTAYLLYEQRARGQHVSQNFLGCSLMVDGIWLAVELYSLIYASKRSLTDEIELVCARTRMWIESGQSGFGPQRAFFWIDSAIGFMSAFFQFAFAEQMLKIIIRRELIITGLHEMYARDFAVQSLLAAIISLVAPFQFGIGAQRVYAAQRILTQCLVFGLHCWAHFAMGIYAPAHTLPFVLSFFHCALLFIVGQRVRAEQQIAQDIGMARAKNSIGSSASTSMTTATVTMRSPPQRSPPQSPKSK